jgi:hypothetical protein
MAGAADAVFGYASAHKRAELPQPEIGGESIAALVDDATPASLDDNRGWRRQRCWRLRVLCFNCCSGGYRSILPGDHPRWAQ